MDTCSVHMGHHGVIDNQSDLDSGIGTNAPLEQVGSLFTHSGSLCFALMSHPHVLGIGQKPYSSHLGRAMHAFFQLPNL